MLGMDERSSKSKDLIRADTIIIAHIPKTHDRIFLISLPRDAEVQIPVDGMQQRIEAQAKPRQDNFSAIAAWVGQRTQAPGLAT